MTRFFGSDSEPEGSHCIGSKVSDAVGQGISRRDLLKALPVMAALTACRRALPYRPGDFARPARSTVAILDAPNYSVDLGDVISRGLRELAFDVSGRSVLLKPNLIEYEPGRLINTNPLVAAGAATAFLHAGATEVIIAEGPGHRRDMEYLLAATGFADQLKDLRVRFVDLNHDDVRPIALRSHFTGIDEILLPVELMKADVIVSLPKLKTHHWAAMTASMKNFFGVVPGAVYGWPKNFLHFHGIDNSIVDLVATIRPHFTIVDAVTAMEGDGPIMGRPRQTGFLAMGQDLVAVDATCARLIGFEPTKIQYLSWAGDFLGNIDEKHIDHRGENLARYQTRFDVLPNFKELQIAGGA
jgi:uncharacterized protein (DUF362 family)